MLSKASQKKFINKRCKATYKYLDNFAHTHNPAIMHGIRVEMKQLKALVLFQQQCGEKKKHAAGFIPLEPIFKHAGRVRNTHLNNKLIEQYKIPGTLIKKAQKNLLAKETHTFLLRHKQYAGSIKKIQAAILKDITGIKSKCILYVYGKQLKKIHKALTAKNYPAELHACRKKIKKLLTVYAILPKRLTKKLSLDTAYMNDVQDKIGKWHDAIIANQFLTKAHIKNKAIIETLKGQQANSLASVNSLLVDFSKKLRH